MYWLTDEKSHIIQKETIKDCELVRCVNGFLLMIAGRQSVQKIMLLDSSEILIQNEVSIEFGLL